MKKQNFLLRVFLSCYFVFQCLGLSGQSKMELMQHWAPQVYQDTRNDKVTVLFWSHQFYEAQDFILKVNYDGNWYAGDQRENSRKQASSCGVGFEGHAYASMVETNTHYFFGYGFYHSMDDAYIEADRHENDYEDVYICVRKDGSYYGQFQALVTNRHGDRLKYTKKDLDFTNDHAQIYISSNGDVTGSCGIHAHGHGIEAYKPGNHCTGGDAIIYNVADEGQVPTYCGGGAFTRSYNYSLIDIDELWNRRLDWNNHPFGSYGIFGGDGNEDNGGNPPWRNGYFNNPAQKFLSDFGWLDDNVSYSTNYLHNPYYGNNSDGSVTPTIDLGENWKRKDIGSPSESGYSWIWKDMFTISGAGKDIWGTSDQFHYVYQTLLGDGEIVTRLYTIQENINSWSKAGIMIRESLNANSKFSMIVGTSHNGVSFQNRTNTGGSAIHNTHKDIKAAPGWLKLKRSGNTFRAYYSANGNSWTLIGTKNISMSSSVYIGLAVTSHNVNSLCSATFTNVSVVKNTLKAGFINEENKKSLEDQKIKVYSKENVLVLTLLSETLQNSRLIVYDLMGRVVLDTKAEAMYNEYIIANKGMYVVRVISSQGTQHKSKVLIK